MAERAVPTGVREKLGIGPGLTFVQAPHSPFCISIRAALEAARAPFTLFNTSIGGREAVIELTGGAYYAVPVILDADRSPAVVVYEGRDDGTDVARYADAKFGLGLFPDEHEGLNDLLVRYIESEIEDVGFRLDDAFLIPALTDPVERTLLLRHKERKFGKGCVDQWRASVPQLMAKLVDVLTPLETVLARKPFLLGDRPVYADYALFGVLGNLTYTGDNEIPAEVPSIRRWHERLSETKLQAKQAVPA
jgi:glutathione S-transferase